MEKQHISDVGAAKIAAVSAKIAAIDPDLARLVEAWPTLPADMRARILAIIEAST